MLGVARLGSAATEEIRRVAHCQLCLETRAEGGREGVVVGEETRGLLWETLTASAGTEANEVRD